MLLIPTSRFKGIRPYSPGVTALQDWINRSTATGVVQSQRFTSSSDVSLGLHGVSYPNVTFDASDGIIGDGALKVNIPSTDGANSGAWWIPLNSSWTSDGEGFGSTDFYVQFRWKPGANRFVATNGGGGFKIVLFGCYKFSDPANSISHPIGEFEIGSYIYNAMLSAYRDASSSPPGGGSADGFYEPYGPSDFKLQNAIDNGSGLSDPDRFCLYQGGPTAGCWYIDDQAWMTIDVHIKQASMGGTTGNRFELWATRYGSQVRTKLLNFSDFTLGFDSVIPNGVNMFYATPYDTGRIDSSVDTAVWYDQIIVSTQMIAVPVW